MSKFIFGSAVTVDKSLTLEVDNSILETALEGQALVLRGQSGTSAAVCTDFSTHQLRQVVNSNTCFLVESSIPPDPPTKMTRFPQQIVPLTIESSHTISSLVTCNYDLLPPTTTDDEYCFQQFLALFPQSKQFHYNHMKLLLTIYKQDRNLYYKLLHNLTIAEYKSDQDGLFHEFSLAATQSSSTTSTPSPSKPSKTSKSPNTDNVDTDPLDFLAGLDSLQHANQTAETTTQPLTSPTKRPRRSLYQTKSSYERDGQTFRLESSIAIKQSKVTSNLIVTTNNVSAAQADQSIHVLFDWSSQTSFSSLYGYDFATLSQLIQTSKYQLHHFLPQFPIIYLEGRYNLLSYDIIHHVIHPILDLCGFLRTKFNTPTINPSKLVKPNPITGLNTTTPSLIFSRNFLLHELEIDGICCPLVAMSVLLYFIDWETTAAIYTPLPPLSEGASQQDIELHALKSAHQYEHYQTFFATKTKPSQTSSIPHTLPHMYQDYESYNFHINDLFGFRDEQYVNAKSITALSSQSPRTALVSNIPPIFALSMSKVVRFTTQHITTQHHYQQHSTYDDMQVKQQLPPSIPMEQLLKQLREKLLEPLLPSFSSILIDLAGAVMIDDPVYTPQKGFHPMFNTKSKTTPQLPLTFNLEEYSQRSQLYFISNTIHNPAYIFNSKLSLINSPKERFDFLFKMRKQWSISAIKPFLVSLVRYSSINPDRVKGLVGPHIFPTQDLLDYVLTSSIDQLLLKFTRAVTNTVKDAGGDTVQTNVTYCAR